MHPGYKLSYFRKADWPEDWIQEARRLVTHEWTMRYKPTTVTPSATASSESSAHSRPRMFRMSTGGKAVSSLPLNALHYIHSVLIQINVHEPRETRDLFASISGRSAHTDRDALEAYLEAAPLTTVRDPLAYWNAALKSGSEDPALARMALDFLSIPGKY